MKKTLFLSICFAVFLTGCGRSADSADDSGLETMTAPPVKASFERPLPEFAKVTSNGDSLLSGSLQGKVTLVNFWATWCGPCVIETPELVALQDEWEDRDFQIVGVSMDEEGFDAVGPFADDFKIQYPLVLDDGALADEFGGVYALPTTFVVDSEGMILHRFIGVFPFEEMRPELEKLLEEAGRP